MSANLSPLSELGATDSPGPSYTTLERRVDLFIHCFGLAALVPAVPWLIGRVVDAGGTATQILALSVYALGLAGMLGASAAYHFAAPGRWKALFRRLDHAMIFVMIAGSYMPYAFRVLPPRLGHPLAATVWGLAALGILLKFFMPRGREWIFLLLYLAMGWVFLLVTPSLVARMPLEETFLLFGGGIVYSLGSLVHAAGRMPFHNALWHAMVLTAAGLHFFAAARLFSV